MVDRNLRSGPVHKQFFAGSMLLAQNHILCVLPIAIELAEAAVAISFRFLRAVLLPEQLQGEVLMLLKLAMQRNEIGSGAILAACRAPAAGREQ
jgi:hypothetical protein